MFKCSIRIFGGSPPKIIFGGHPQISSFIGRSNLVSEFLGGHPAGMHYIIGMVVVVVVVVVVFVVVVVVDVVVVVV